jgi:ABC-2 type transport system ATP-binding protein
MVAVVARHAEKSELFSAGKRAQPTNANGVGHVRVLGYDPVREPLAVKRRVGYLPDSVGFYDELSAIENLSYTARLMGISRADRESRIASALTRVGLQDVADDRVATFSRGMRQRLGIAEIIMKDSAIAILDEPTSGLDPQGTAEVLEMIRSLKDNGVTVLISSHLLDRVQSVCDHVALFQAGKIVIQGSVEELGRQVLGGGFTVDVEAVGTGFIESPRRLGGVQSVELLPRVRFAFSPTRDVRPDVAATIVKEGGRLLRLSIGQANLATIYHRYLDRTELPAAA